MRLTALVLAVLQTLNVHTQMRPNVGDRQCPYISNSLNCDCERLAQGIALNCQGINQNELVKLVGTTRSSLVGLKLTRLPADLTHLQYWVLANSTIQHLYIQNSYVKEIDENFFEWLEKSLVSVTISDSRLSYVPRGINKIGTLMQLDLSGNNITELYPYSFFGASLWGLTLSRNFLHGLSDNSFLGLEGNLKTLNLDYNRFKKFPLQALKNLQSLQSLNLGGNKIESIEYMSGVELRVEKLFLKNNNFKFISETTFYSMTGLVAIDLSYNEIQNIDTNSFSVLVDLETLNLGTNRLEVLDSQLFSRNLKLKLLNLGGNHVRVLSSLLANLPNLATVHLENNFLTSIGSDTFAGSRSIRDLYLHNNVIQELDDSAFSSLNQLRRLKLSNNFLSRVSGHLFTANPALLTLGLDNNQIRSIDSSAFKTLLKLQNLNLHHNSIKEIREDLLGGLHSLQHLSLDNNKIYNISVHSFSSLSSLQYLSLIGNKLVHLEDVMMRYPSSLVSLHLTDNKISQLDKFAFNGQTTLELLEIGNNKIDAITQDLFRELINLFKLKLFNNRISSIEDKALGHCVQLRYLDLSDNRLTQLGSQTLQGLNQLEEINLSNNKLKNIARGAFQSLHHLKILNLGGNELSTLGEASFHGCQNVHTLLIQNARISSIQTGALRPFKSLRRLDIRENQISNFKTWNQIEELSGLKTLKLSGNSFSNISGLMSIAKFSHLEQIEMSACSIQNINPQFLAGNKKLKSIDLSWNAISDLEPEFFSKQVFLNHLSLAGNMLELVPGSSLLYLYNLRSLNLSYNSLNSLNDSSFDEVIGLTDLDVSMNQIQHISSRVFHNVTKLEVLSLNGNAISKFASTTFLPMNNLQKISVENNLLEYVPVALQGLRNVTEMKIGSNPLKRFREMISSSGVMGTLKHLYITGSALTELTSQDASLCPNLITLTLRGNNISVIHPNAFSKQKVLLILDLSYNKLLRLHSSSLIGLHKLEHLNLSRNSLTSLEEFPPELSTLKILDLSENQLYFLKDRMLYNLKNLVKLDLRLNRLTNLDSDVFSQNSALKSVDLSDNQFQKIPSEAINTLQHSLESLHIQDNPLVCSCRTYKHKIWIRNNRKWMDKSKKNSKIGPQCAEPEAVQDRYLFTIKDSELCPLPSVDSFRVRNITTTSVLISWESTDSNMTGLKGFLVAYHRLDQNDIVKKYKVNPTTRLFQLLNLNDNSVYLVCIITQGSSYSDYDYTDDSIQTTTEYIEDREQRDLTGDSFEDDGYYADQDFSPFSDNEFDETEIPSSNDTRYIISKPIILNLDSTSSRCDKIRTPQDTSKLRLIDDKQMGIVIGCSSGLVIFILIIISIVCVNPVKDDEEQIVPAKSDSLCTDSYKSPSIKSRSNSMAQLGSSSQASSLTKLNGDTLKKNSISARKNSQASPNKKQSRRQISKQSSIESGPLSHKSRDSSSDTSAHRKRMKRQESEYLMTTRPGSSLSKSPPRPVVDTTLANTNGHKDTLSRRSTLTRQATSHRGGSSSQPHQLNRKGSQQDKETRGKPNDTLDRRKGNNSMNGARSRRDLTDADKLSAGRYDAGSSGHSRESSGGAVNSADSGWQQDHDQGRWNGYATAVSCDQTVEYYPSGQPQPEGRNGGKQITGKTGYIKYSSGGGQNMGKY